MNKSYLSQLINIIVIPIILNIAITDNLHGATGLAGQVHDFQITAFLFMTLFNLVNVPDLYIKFLNRIPFLKIVLIQIMLKFIIWYLVPQLVFTIIIAFYLHSIICQMYIWTIIWQRILTRTSPYISIFVPIAFNISINACYHYKVSDIYFSLTI